MIGRAAEDHAVTQCLSSCFALSVLQMLAGCSRHGGCRRCGGGASKEANRELGLVVAGCGEVLVSPAEEERGDFVREGVGAMEEPDEKEALLAVVEATVRACAAREMPIRSECGSCTAYSE